MSSEPSTLARPFSEVDRRALVSVAVQFFVNGAVVASFVPRLPEIRERIGVGLDGLGLLMTIAITIGTVGGLRSPNVIDRFGTRRTLIVGGILLVVALPLLGIATAASVFVAGMALMLIADSFVDVSMNLQGSWISARRHAPVMNRLHGLWSLGTVVGGLVAAQSAAAGVPLAVHLTVAAAVMLVALVFVGRGLLSVDEGGDDGVDTTTAVNRSRAAMVALSLLAFAGALSITVEIVSSDWAAFRLSEDFGATAGFAGLGYVAFTIGMTIGRFGGDSAQLRLGDDRLLQTAVLISGIGLATAALVPNRWVVLAAYLVAGVGVSTFFPKLYDEAAKFKGRRGRGVAWLRTGSSLTALVVPTLVGVLASTNLSVGAATAIVTLPCVAGLLAFSLRPRPA